MSRTTSRLSKSYTEFLEYTLLPVETPAANANCAICRLHFVKTEEQELLDELGYGTMMQSKILAAALAAAREPGSLHGIVVRVRHCGHPFHKDCLCTWITGEAAAPEYRRSCPLCETELVRYGMCARAEDLLLESRKVAQALSELEVRYDNAYEPSRRLEELEQEVAGVMEDFRNKTYNLSKPTKDSLFTQLHNVLNKEHIWGRDLDYLEQLLLDGHSTSESIQTWYIYKLDTAQETFRTESKKLSAQLEPLDHRLGEVEETLIELSKEVYKAHGLSNSQVSSQIHEIFYSTASTDSDEVPDEPQEGSWFQDDTGVKLNHPGAEADWLRNEIVYIKFRASKLEAADHVKQVDEEDAGDAYTAYMDEEGVDHD